MNKKASKLTDILKWTIPWNTAIMDNPTANDMWKNVLGVTAVTAPSVALMAWIANEAKMRKMRKSIDKNTIQGLNARMPVLTPDERIGNEGQELAVKEDELRRIGKALGKKANSVSWLDRTVRGVAPMVAVPAATWLTAIAVNKLLKDKYEEELQAENRALQDMQNKLDMEELQRLGYIQKAPTPVPAVKPVKKDTSAEKPMEKKAATGSWTDLGGDLIVRPLTNLLPTVWGSSKKAFIDVPSQLLLLATLGISGYGVHHFLKKHEDSKKLKLLDEKMLGKDRLMDSPKLMINLPKDYEETGKKTAQLIPGISPALIPQNIVEDAEIVEKPKKDAFLG